VRRLGRALDDLGLETLLRDRAAEVVAIVESAVTTRMPRSLSPVL